MCVSFSLYICICVYIYIYIHIYYVACSEAFVEQRVRERTEEKNMLLAGKAKRLTGTWHISLSPSLYVPNLWCHIPRLSVLTHGRFSVKTLIACGGRWGPGGDTQPLTVCCGAR